MWRFLFWLTHERIADAINTSHGIWNLVLRQQAPQRHDVLVERMSFFRGCCPMPKRGAQRLVRHEISHIRMQANEYCALVRSSHDFMAIVEDDRGPC